MQKNSPLSWCLYFKLPIDIDFIHFICQFHQSCGINARECFQGQLHHRKACWELRLSEGQPHSDYNGQWQRALCMMAVLYSSQPNPQMNKQKKENVCYKTNQHLCRMPGHATQASAGFVTYTRASAYRPQPRFLTNPHKQR